MSRTKIDSVKPAYHKPRQSSESKPLEKLDANEAMLMQSIKVMMEDIQSGIVEKFEPIISEAFK